MKTLSTLIISIAVLVLLFASNCEKIVIDKKYPLTLKNLGSKPIGYYFATGGKYGTLYPDTTLPIRSDYLGIKLESNKIFSYDSSTSWDTNYKAFPRDTLSIFIFETDTLLKYPWQVIRQKYKILKRYDLSLQDLKKLNYSITYPAGTIMKEIKMYPAYP